MNDRVTLYIRAEGAPSEEEDGHVPGAYMVEVDADLAPADRASAAPDIFHGRVAVGCLDDFTIALRGSPAPRGGEEALVVSPDQA